MAHPSYTLTAREIATLDEAFEDYIERNTERVIDEACEADLVVYFEAGEAADIDTIDEALECFREALGR